MDFSEPAEAELTRVSHAQWPELSAPGRPPLAIVILGLTITSSWGNGHATTYRSLVRGLARRGHSVLFLERDKPWYRDNRDVARPPYGETRLYSGIEELADCWRLTIRNADTLNGYREAMLLLRDTSESPAARPITIGAKPREVAAKLWRARA